MEGVLVVLLVLLVYFVPIIVASNRKHPHAAGIAVINIFLGWTLVGWVAALAWACVQPQAAKAAEPESAMPAFPVTTGPATYRISGGDKETGFDVVEYVRAESEANARAKAELRGVVVTNVRWAEDEITRDREAAERRRGIAHQRRKHEPQPTADASQSNVRELSDKDIEAAIREARRHKQR